MTTFKMSSPSSFILSDSFNRFIQNEASTNPPVLWNFISVRTDGRMDGQTDSPCVLQDFVPFGAAAQLPINLNHRLRARVPLTTYFLCIFYIFQYHVLQTNWFFLTFIHFFLGATKHLYNWLCPSVGLLVCNAFVRRSTRRTYWPTWPCLVFTMS